MVGTSGFSHWPTPNLNMGFCRLLKDSSLQRERLGLGNESILDSPRSLVLKKHMGRLGGPK